MKFQIYLVVTLLSLPFAVSACTGSKVDNAQDSQAVADTDDGIEDITTSDDAVGADVTTRDADEADAAILDTTHDADEADGEAPPDGTALVQIRMVSDGETISGSVTIELAPVGRVERLVDYVTLKINGEIVFTDTKLPTRLVLDTTKWETNRLTFLAEAQDVVERGSHEIALHTNNPQIKFTEVTPRTTSVKNGDIISLVVRIDAPNDVDLTADFSALDSEFNPLQPYTFTVGGGEYTLTYVVNHANTRPDGVYAIPLKAKLGLLDVQYTLFSLRLQNKPVIPVTVTNGIFVNAPPPATDPAWVSAAPIVTATNSTIVTGGTSVISTTVNGQLPNTDIVGVILSLDGHNGYYQVPVDRESPPPNGLVEATLHLRQFGENEAVPIDLQFGIALRDGRGRISPYQPLIYRVIKVGGGDLQFTLAWDTIADLDMHIVDPYNCEIYYGRRTCTQSGGRLDLDANIGCSSGPQTENVFWPEGGAPPGTYVAKINRFSDSCCQSTCSEGHNYTMTINYCGRTEVYEGRIPYGQSTTSSGAGSNNGIIIATIDNQNCGRRAQGRVRYQDRDFDQTGFGAYRWRSVEGAFVELRELGTNAVLGTSVTDTNGDYLIPFSMSIAGYVVAVMTRTDEAEGLRNIKLYDHPEFKRIYEVTSAPVIFVDNDDDAITRDIDITVNKAAGAFNIFDVLRQSYDQVRLATGRDLGELRGFWATGADATDTIYCSTYLYNNGVCTEVGSVSVQGKDTDRDEYDDMVIAREFFKFALNQLAKDSHPGEEADGRRDDPRRSWTEGVATYFAADLLGSRYYVDSRPHAVYIVDDLEDMQSPFSVKTADNLVSRYLVMSVLWDLSDSDNEDQDEVDRMRNAIYDVLFTHFHEANLGDRGPEGVDLTDFLDGWLCEGWGMSDALVRLLDYYEYNYDFAGPSGCWTP